MNHKLSQAIANTIMIEWHWQLAPKFHTHMPGINPLVLQLNHSKYHSWISSPM